MGYLFIAVLALMIGGAALWLGFTVAAWTTPVAGLLGVGLTVVEFSTSGFRAFRADAPIDRSAILPPAPDPRRRTFGRDLSALERGPDPAYRSYYFGPAHREFVQILTETARRSVDSVSRWIAWLQRRVVQQFPSLLWKVLVCPVAWGAMLGLVAGGVVGGLLVGLISLVFLVVLSTACFVALGVGAVFQVVEKAALTWRGISLECPACRHRVIRPIYRCSGQDGCGASHVALIPGRLGIFGRTCQCSRVLPTLLALGKNRLAAQCPECGDQLPLRGFSAPTLHVPVAGGPQTGKSVFMYAGVKRFHDEWRGSGSDADFWADETFAADFRNAQEALATPENMRKTTERRPRAYNFYVGRQPGRRLFYLYDTAGEMYDTPQELSETTIFSRTGGVVFCIDPLSLAGVRRVAERSLLDRNRSQPANPQATVERLTETLRETLRAPSSRVLPVPAAVVITKADALSQVGVVHPYQLSAGSRIATREERSAAVRRWLDEVAGRADIVATIANNYRQVSFFVVSHTGAFVPPGGTATDDLPDAPLRWLMEVRK